MDVDRCSEWRSLVSCRLDGELDELQSVRLESHLRGCAACSAWAREIASLTRMIHDSQPALPARSLDFRAYALRRRLVRGITVGATAASAAAVAAVALGLPGSAISPFSSVGPRVASPPSLSSTKKQVVTLVFTDRTATHAAAPVHVAHPLVVPE